MSPPAGTSLFMRFFGLSENIPLYVMVGIACGLAAYTPVRHLKTAPDISLNTNDRDDNLGQDSRRILARARNYEGGILGAVASIKSWPEVWAAPTSIAQEHFHLQRWPAPRPMEIPMPAEK